MPRHLQHRGPAAVIATAGMAARHLVRRASIGMLGAALALSVAACNTSETGFAGSVGSTPNGTPLASYVIVGTPSTSFTATISDSRSSWTFQGIVPLEVTVCNNTLPVRMIATKTTSNNNLLSLEPIVGNHVAEIQSTTAPFGTVAVQVGGTLTAIAAPASPDLRIFAEGPANSAFSALVEDSTTGFVIDGRVPVLVLFDNPDGKVDATFYAYRDYGTFDLNMTYDGVLVAAVHQGPDATIREP